MPLLLPYFKFNVQDWITSESILKMTSEQVGAYILLLAHSWSTATCTLPNDLATLRTLSRWTGSNEALQPVLSCFKPAKCPRGRLVNPRLYAEWKQAMNLTTKLQESGQKGAAKRWATPVHKEKENGASSSRETWAAYLEAYQRRYHVDPVRNQTINSHLAQLVKRLGVDEAPQVATFYLTHNKPFYVSARHPTNLLLRDCEGLRTEWATGVKSTTLEARSAETLDAAQEQIKRVGKLLEGRRHETA